MSAALKLWSRLSRWPGGAWLYGRLICLRAPYFATIAPRFVRLEPGRCEITLRDRRRVHNHIGTVHAIALCNLAELCAGVMSEATLPTGMRWIPKGMTVEYLAKAVGTMHAVATPQAPAVAFAEGREWPVQVDVRDAGGQAVFRAVATMWVSPRRA
ncbi:hotdog fold domain-containing protein [Fulvimonas sp. R45]|uniref:hotdog fold domain-containing protein n=1 Tax=Fulvimonas sp. R45 TaxID=3045937 RepID=UPI00265D6ACA|nr:hotdog fold domain-containing protein [Fulvimonas sp. R45]MDO1527672.1 hotdog fold domain-containing protein [Fulvimonas sp. R45]